MATRLRMFNCLTTAQEWLECVHPSPMTEYLSSERKKRLFAVACCRRISDWLGDERSRRCVEFAEQIADRELSSEELAAVHNVATPELVAPGANEPYYAAYAAWAAAMRNAERAVTGAIHGAVRCAAPVVWNDDEVVPAYHPAELAAERALAEVVRDMVGNPFRPVTIEPSWLTLTVVSLAQAIYDERAFNRLPILADALEDAGCENADILNHCRQPGNHVRGCWVVDLMLDKK